MARQLSKGQRAAARAVLTRRGELGLTQKQLAEATGISEATIQNLEAGRHWPRTKTLADLERLGLGWPAGYLTALADKIDAEQDAPSAPLRDTYTFTEAAERILALPSLTDDEKQQLLQQLMDRSRQDRQRRAG